MQDKRDGEELLPTLAEQWRTYWHGPGVTLRGVLVRMVGNVLGVRSYLDFGGEEERRWRVERSQRIAVANGTALATRLLAVVSRPSLFNELRVPGVWF
jgi:hypothetical protein